MKFNDLKINQLFLLKCHVELLLTMRLNLCIDYSIRLMLHN